METLTWQAAPAVRPKYHLKSNRIFTKVRGYSWVLVPVLALGSLYFPVLGLGVALIMLIIMGTGFFSGRYFCGNLCPHGSFFDRFMLPISLNWKIPKFFTSPITKWGFFALYMAMFVVRLGRVMPFWGELMFFERFGALMGRQYLTMPTVVGLSLAFLNPRTWCSFCPMGTLSEITYKAGKALKLNKSTDKKVTIASQELCHTCATCARVCPMQLEPFRNFNGTNQFDSDVCIRCGTCVEACPAGVLSLQTEDGAVRVNADTSLEGYERRHSATAKLECITPLRENVRELTFAIDEHAKNSPEAQAGAKEQTAGELDGVRAPAMGYRPGQFVLVKVSDDPDMYRAYSISSTDPSDPSRLSVTVMDKPGGYGSHVVFNQFAEGQSIELQGPMGHELLVDKSASHVLLVAGGIGITPFVPIVKDLVENPGNITAVTLAYGVNKEHEFLYDEYFRELDEQSDVFTYEKAVAFPDGPWDGYTGFVTGIVGNMDLSDSQIYACGPPPMIGAVNGTLEKMRAEGRGAPEEAVHYETAS